MKNSKLKVTTMTTTGKFNSAKSVGAVYLDVPTSDNKNNQIAIEVSHTTGIGDFKRKVTHERELINITFANGSVWSGDFDKLYEAILSEVNK